MPKKECDNMTTTNSEIGAYLAHLRDKAGLKQNELASKVTWSPAVLSRVESGERGLSPDELDAILDAIGTKEAVGFKKTAERVWKHLPRPPLGHPDEAILWRAEQALERVKELAESPEIKNVIAKRLEAFVSEINSTARLALKTVHNVAFVGKIGVGKTTVLCRIAGLEVLKADRPEPVLAVGSGRTTVCEVRLQQGSGLGLHVEPMDADTFHREVLEFANWLTRPPEEENPEQEEGGQDAQGTSEEIVRVIRNMSGLPVGVRRLPDGKRELIDQAKQLAEEFTDPVTLAGEILSRIELQRRTGRQLWYPESSGQEPLMWLKETFEQLNNGRHPEFALPKRIDISVPQTKKEEQRTILSEGPLSICLVDTKGIDATTERTDLGEYFNEPGTLMVLCSSFNDMPSTEVQKLLSQAKDAGFSHLDAKAVILSLPRPDEALATKDTQGIPAESALEGYELKGDQAEFHLQSRKLPYAGITFFNVREDNPQDLIDFLMVQVEKIRKGQQARLEEIISGAIELVENVDEAKVQEAAHRMTVWLDNNQDIGDLATRLENSLIAAVRRTNASSVRASVRRQGDWHNFNHSYQLGYGARVMATRSLTPKLDNFKAITENLLQDDELEPAFGLIRQARRILEDGVPSILLSSELMGRRIYIQHLEPDWEFWQRCDKEWGRGYVDGLGYRDRVARHHQNWFSDDGRDFQAVMQDLVEREWLQILARLSEILDPEATQAVAA